MAYTFPLIFVFLFVVAVVVESMKVFYTDIIDLPLIITLAARTLLLTGRFVQDHHNSLLDNILAVFRDKH